MSLPEYVYVRRGGITMEVRRGEAQRYIRMGFVLVEDTPIPELDEPPVDLHDGKPHGGSEAPPVDPVDQTHPEPKPEGFVTNYAALTPEEAIALEAMLGSKTHPELDDMAGDAQIEEWKSNNNKSDKIALLVGSGRVYLGNDGEAVIVISPDASPVEKEAENGTT